jgi:FKBP-type peptidyl-prolyl cis-trans isomerase SlyD
MKITKNTVVTVQYKLSDAQNNLLEDGQEPIVYLHGGYENILPAIEKALDGKKVGYTTMIQVEPDDAFGDYDPSLVRVEERDRFPVFLEIGMQFEGIPEDDDEDDSTVIFVVTDIAEGKVVLDGNHPLAGIALRFALNVLDVRAATPEEIEHQHAHGPGVHDDDDEDDEGQDDDQYRSVIIH